MQWIEARANGCLSHRARPAAAPSLAGRPSTIEKVRIATWCVGGVNSRLKYLCHWLIRRKPDLVALQKTFAATVQFPVRALRQAGYESVFYSRDGEFRNGWGVAVLSRVTDPKPKVLQLGVPGQEDRGARFLTVNVKTEDGDLEFSSVYALYGNPGKHGFDGALERKIKWMKLLYEHLDKRSTRPDQCILAGDFNVVSDGKTQTRVLNYTHEERNQLDHILALGFVDLFHSYRLRHPNSGSGCNYGFNIHKPVSARLHRILGSNLVAGQVRRAWVDLEYREKIKELPGCLWAPSAPVIIDLH